MISRKTLAACATAIGLVLSISACSDAGEAPATIKIGFIGTITGGAADIGLTALEGVQIAVDEINTGGGVDGKKLEIIKKDEQLSPVASRSVDKDDSGTTSPSTTRTTSARSPET